MKFQHVAIAAVSHEVPPAILSSDEIERRLAPVYERIGLHPGRLELMTGIKERRYWQEPGIRPSTVAVRAAEKALRSSAVPRAEIGVVVHASVCRDFLEPATAAVVHKSLGLSRECAIFDLSNACLGVMSAIMTVGSMIETGVIRAGLIVSGENGKPLVDSTIQKLIADPNVTRKSIKLAFPSLTIGSGAAAILLVDRRIWEGHRVAAMAHGTASEHVELCEGGHAGHEDGGVAEGAALEMATDAEALLEAGLVLAKSTYASLMSSVAGRRFDKAITHQVGKAHSRALFAALELDPAMSFDTFPWLGNVGSASWPMSLSLAAETGHVIGGDFVGLLGIGSGLSSIMLGVEW